MQSVRPQNAEILKRLTDHQHRLVSLQVSLQEALRAGLINQPMFEERARNIRNSLTFNKTLIAVASASADHLGQESSLGLPNLETCSPEERKICYEFLGERFDTLKNMLTEALTVLNWTSRASTGELWSVTCTFFLSKLRKMISRLDRELGVLPQKNAELDRYIIAMGQHLGKNKKSDELKDNFEAIIKLFSEIDKRGSQVAHLKQRVRDEEERIIYMKNWIAKEEQKIAQPIKFQPPPPLEATALALNMTPLPEKFYLTNTEKKLDLAQSYIETCIKQQRDGIRI